MSKESEDDDPYFLQNARQRTEKRQTMLEFLRQSRIADADREISTAAGSQENNAPFLASAPEPRNNATLNTGDKPSPVRPANARQVTAISEFSSPDHEDYERPDLANDTSVAKGQVEGNGEPLEKSTSTVSIAQTLSPVREFLFVSIICLAQFMTQAALGQVLAIIHVIGDHYSITNPGTLSWLIAGYSLTVGTFILMAGRLGDVFGYKRMLIIGFSWFAFWSVIEGLANHSNHVLFIFARVFAGIGPAIVLTNGLAILGATYAAGPRKDMVFALFGAAAPGGSIVGALFAAIFSGLADNWPWAFYSFGLTLACIAILGILVIPNPPPRKLQLTSSSAGKPTLMQELDVLGGLIGITALVLFNFAWNQAGVVGWKSPYVCVTLVLGLLLAPVFFYVELHVSKFPLLPFEILKAEIGFVLACMSCGWGCFGIWVYYTWQFLLTTRNNSPLVSAAEFSPVAITGAVAAITTGFLLSRLRPAIILMIALTAFLIGTL